MPAGADLADLCTAVELLPGMAVTSRAAAVCAGLSASELYVVKTGEFEVLQRRKVRAGAGMA